MTTCSMVDIGSLDYLEALALQRRVHSRVANGDLPNVLLLLQHPPVYTMGRRASRADVLAPDAKLRGLGVDVCRTDRGGAVTYHGPGQLICYPILRLRELGMGPLSYVRALERVVASMLAELGIIAASDSRPTGVWVGDAKIAAIGVRVSKGATMHGAALNVCTDLSYFDHIVPCGMPSVKVTSMREQGATIDVSRAVDILAPHFARVFSCSLVRSTPEEIGESVNTPSHRRSA